MSSAICFNLDQSKILSSSNGLKNTFTKQQIRSGLRPKTPDWEKEKLLNKSDFSFSHSVFKRLVLQTRKNQGVFGKGLNLYQRQLCSAAQF